VGYPPGSYTTPSVIVDASMRLINLTPGSRKCKVGSNHINRNQSFSESHRTHDRIYNQCTHVSSCIMYTMYHHHYLKKNITAPVKTTNKIKQCSLSKQSNCQGWERPSHFRSSQVTWHQLKMSVIFWCRIPDLIGQGEGPRGSGSPPDKVKKKSSSVIINHPSIINH